MSAFTLQALGIPPPGASRNWWDVAGIDMTGQGMLTWGASMRWVLRLIETGMPSGVAGVDVMEISRPDGASNIADLGLTLSEAKQLLARVQQAIVAAQAGDLAVRRPECSSCSGRCHVNSLAMPFARDTIRQGDGTTAAVSLRQLRSHRALCHLAIALSIDA